MKAVLYHDFMSSLYGSNFWKRSQSDIVITFNVPLREQYPQYRFLTSDADACEYVFNLYREDITRKYFDSSSIVLDAHREKWLLKNRKKAKELFGPLNDVILYLTADMYFGKIFRSHESQLGNLKIDDYYGLTDAGITLYKMALACSTALERIDKFAPNDVEADRCLQMLSSRRRNE